MGRKRIAGSLMRRKENTRDVSSVVSIILLVILSLSICKILTKLGRVTSNDVKYRCN
jgi:hypothetical protein